MHRRKLRYKGMPVNMFGLPDISYYRNKKNVPQKVPKRQYLKSFAVDFKKNGYKNLLIIYDIPEAKKKERDWFRRQLINFSFIMIQRSVWVGPSPLPADFLAYVKDIGLKKEFKTFKLAKPYSD